MVLTTSRRVTSDVDPCRPNAELATEHLPADPVQIDHERGEGGLIRVQGEAEIEFDRLAGRKTWQTLVEPPDEVIDEGVVSVDGSVNEARERRR